jgi:hypothetical protein
MRAYLKRKPWIWVLLLFALFVAGDVLFISIAQRAWSGVEVLR